ncbi:MAG: hypothetical protein NTX25_07595 [Proteobacteria bacterium]|nr:hypothetical protein [Pseudomonadota bacterium]
MIQFCLVLLLLSSSFNPILAKSLESSILRIHSVVQATDYDAPWTAKQTERMVHMGLVLGEDKLLTAAFAVKDARYIEAEILGDPKRYPLEVEFVDNIANLAIMRFSQERPLGLKELQLGEDLGLGENAALYQGLEGEALIANAVKVREIELRPIYLGEYALPQYLFEMRRPGYGWFEPILRNDKLVAVAIGQSSGTVYALPSRLIKRFLEDFLHPPYRGFVEPGLEFSTMLSPYLRTYAKAEELSDGVWISRVRADSPFADLVQVGDVLFEFQGKPVSARGSYFHPKWGRVGFLAQLADMRAGDSLKIAVLRNGKRLDFEKKLNRYDPATEKIPPPAFSEPDYLIFGGFLFQELSASLLQSWGPQWKKRAPLPYLFSAEFDSESSADGKSRIVVLQRVLPIEFNKGYHDLEDLIVKNINGRNVENLNELNNALSDAKARESGFSRIILEPGHIEIVVSYAGLDEAHQTLRKRYAIPSTGKFWKPRP